MKAACVVDTKELMKRSLEKHLQIKIIDVERRNGCWYALIPQQERSFSGGWFTVSSLLKRPEFAIKCEGGPDSELVDMYIS